ncbi:hypothetical protein SAMN04490186_3953 [Pseudomonas grimontii]|uniref:Uncharacterized protein n=1 Tax=Pseudomonas grimontii TaxID=129847 RepID=A0A1H1H3P3_9PSED|nr:MULTISPECIES: hypothetical protein [Pseudomonas]MCF5723891.1 hypothetical protein [Pseudomonas syringae]TWR67257.1 hypothetical protein FIV39_11220 [Pseudomonas grimontii]SDR20060.1 hypothetical protein SAMN04490186_3953 [Pseudomonas grimontii]VVP63083.1 hypothetical protein PS907_00130 [Pseudomonas fluorescens]
MSDVKLNALSATHYYNGDDRAKRIIAVSAALELIASRASSADSVHLEQEFDNLNKYADQIQAAIQQR